MRKVFLLAGSVFLIASQVAGAQTDASHGDSKAPGSASATQALFDQLDANGDGYLSRDEAAAAEPIADRYESMNTNNTLEKQARHNDQGIDYAQFEAGIQAARSSGAFGPAVSGGQTYLVYPDGHRERIGPDPNASDR